MIRKFLFLALATLAVATSSFAQFTTAVVNTRRPSGIDTQIGPITVTFRNDQRTNVPFTIPATSISAVTSWYWEVYKHVGHTSTLFNASYDEDPTFNLPDTGFYDVTLLAKSAKDTWSARWDDIFIVQPPQFTEAQADLVVDITSANYFHDFANVPQPDLKIFLKGLGTHYFQPYQLFGTLGHPVRIQVDPTTGVHLTTPDGTSQGFWLNQCGYVHVDGFLSDGSNGLFLQALTPNTAQVFAATGTNFTNIGIAGATVYQDRATMVLGSAAMTFIPNTPDATYNSSTFLSRDNYVYRCTVTQSKDEGLYFMFNNDNLQGSYRPIKTWQTVIAWNTFTNTGRDGIQVASTINGRIHNNYINTCGLNHSVSQESLISWNGGNSNCYVYNNFGVNAEMILNIQMGNNPFNKYAGESTPGPLYIWGNIFRVKNYSPGTTTEPDAIYIQNESSVTGTGTWTIHFLGNLLFSDDKFLCESASWTGSSAISHKWYNNLCIKFGSDAGRTAPELNYAGPNNNQTRTLNDLVRTYPTISDLLFSSILTDDYTLSSFSSAAYSGSTSDLAAIYPSLTMTDYSGYPILAPGQSYTYGPYSGYEKRIVTPTTADPNPGTFTTPVTVTSLTQTTGTLGYEANKQGLLYYIVSPVDTEPSKPQIRGGQLASGSAAPYSGTVIDLGTVVPKVLTPLVESTSYYLFCVFVTAPDNVEQGSVTRVVFTTSADLVAPTLTGFTIPDAARTHITFTTSKAITATTFSNFTLASPSNTIDSIHIVPNATTGHYFIAHTAYTYSNQTPTITYSGGNNWKDITIAQNALASFSAAAIVNAIAPDPQQAVVWVNAVVTPTVAGANVTSTAIGDNARSSQIIPAASDGYIIFDWNTITRSDFQGARIGFGGATATRTLANIKMSLDIRASNPNIDIYESTTYKNTVGAVSASGFKYKFTITRTANGGDDKIRFYSSPDGTTYTLKYTYSTTTTGDLRMFCFFNTSGKGVVNAGIQANNGLN